MSKIDAPFKMKGHELPGPNQKAGSPLYDHEKDESGKVIKHEKKYFAEDTRTDAEKKADQESFEKAYPDPLEREYLNDPDAFEIKYPDGPPKTTEGPQ